MKGKVAAFIMAALLALYVALTFQKAVAFLSSGDWLGISMGVALLLLPILGAWGLYRELLFGFRTEKLVKILAERGELPEDDLPKHPSGRPIRGAADDEFPQYKAEVEAEPDRWQAWFRLGLAYDASGDRRRARQALRQSIALYRRDPAERSA